MVLYISQETNITVGDSLLGGTQNMNSWSREKEKEIGEELLRGAINSDIGVTMTSDVSGLATRLLEEETEAYVPPRTRMGSE